MNPFEQKIFDSNREWLTDDLISDEFLGRVGSQYCGHCHSAIKSLLHGLLI